MTLPRVSTVALAAGVVLYFLPLLPRLVGLGFVDRSDPRSWFFAGVLVAALAAVTAFRHPGESESFFLLSAYPVAVVGSAWGLARAWDRHRCRAGVAVGGGVIGAALCGAIALTVPGDPRAALAASFGHAPTALEMSPLRQAAHTAAPLVLLAVALGLLATLGRVWARRDAGRRVTAATMVTAAVLGTGVLGTLAYLWAGPASTASATTAGDPGQQVTRDEFDAASWLRTHSRPDDVYATNRVCLAPQPSGDLPDPCVSKSFAISAVAARQAYVGSWAYASRNLDSAWASTAQPWSAQPFWNPSALDLEQRSFRQPTAETITALRAAGVSWLIADPRGAPAATAALDRLAAQRFSTPSVTVWQVAQP